MERVEAPFRHQHPPNFGYYGGPEDGRSSRLSDVMDAVDFEHALMASVQINYTCVRFGQHPDGTICWVLWMFSPIEKRGKL